MSTKKRVLCLLILNLVKPVHIKFGSTPQQKPFSVLHKRKSVKRRKTTEMKRRSAKTEGNEMKEAKNEEMLSPE